MFILPLLSLGFPWVLLYSLTSAYSHSSCLVTCLYRDLSCSAPITLTICQTLLLHGPSWPPHPAHLVLSRLFLLHGHDLRHAEAQYHDISVGVRGILLHLLRRLLLGHLACQLDVRLGNYAAPHEE